MRTKTCGSLCSPGSGPELSTGSPPGAPVVAEDRMEISTRISLVWLVASMLLAGCAGPQASPGAAPSERAGLKATAPKRMTLGLPGDVTVLARIAVQGGASAA